MDNFSTHVRPVLLSVCVFFMTACAMQQTAILKESESLWVGVWDCATQSRMQRLGKNFTARASTVDEFTKHKKYFTQGELVFGVNSRQYVFTIQGEGTWFVENSQLVQRLNELTFEPKDESMMAKLLAVFLQSRLALDEEKKANIELFTEETFEAVVILEHMTEKPKVTVKCRRQEPLS